MKRRSEPRRAATEPVFDNLYDRSIKVQGIVLIDDAKTKSKCSIIEVKPENKVLFNCYKRYKTFSFVFDHIGSTSAEQGCFGSNFKQSNAADSIQNDLNYMLYCVGTKTQSNSNMSYTQHIICEQLTAVFNNLIKHKEYQWKLYALAVGEEALQEVLGTKKNVQIRQTMSNKTPITSQICFVDCEHQSPQSEYQVVEFVKEVFTKKNKMVKCHLAIFGQIQYLHEPQTKTKMLLIDAIKNEAEDKNWDNGSNLVLNKCILGLLNKMENNQSKQSYAPFRDSKLTRLMKPFLTCDSRVDAVGFINPQDEQTPLPTLSLVRNLTRLKVPLTKNICKENPQSNSRVTSLGESEQRMKSQMKNSRIQSTNDESQDKPDRLEEMRKSAQLQLDSVKNISRIRLKLKMMMKRKQVKIPGIDLDEGSTMLDKFEENEVQFMKKKQLQAIENLQNINNKRVQSIQKSISKVEKLKMLRQYYTVSLSNQKKETEQFIKNQQMMSEFYEQKLKCIESNLKKSPKQLIQNTRSQRPQRQSKSRPQKNSLPYIADKKNKRAVYIKQQLKKGRVEYQDFLTKNVSQYKSYSAGNEELA